jgi:hypothetical protein
MRIKRKIVFTKDLICYYYYYYDCSLYKYFCFKQVKWIRLYLQTFQLYIIISANRQQNKLWVQLKRVYWNRTKIVNLFYFFYHIWYFLINGTFLLFFSFENWKKEITLLSRVWLLLPRIKRRGLIDWFKKIKQKIKKAVCLFRINCWLYNNHNIYIKRF